MTAYEQTRLDQLTALVIEQGRVRAKNMGPDFNEADYLAGAMVLLSELFGGGETCVPAPWVFEIMRGGSVLFPERPRKEEPARSDLLRFARQIASVQRAGDLDRHCLWEDARELFGIEEEEE
jgi:hypothetical protein